MFWGVVRGTIAIIQGSYRVVASFGAQHFIAAIRSLGCHLYHFNNGTGVTTTLGARFGFIPTLLTISVGLSVDGGSFGRHIFFYGGSTSSDFIFGAPHKRRGVTIVYDLLKRGGTI